MNNHIRKSRGWKAKMTGFAVLAALPVALVYSATTISCGGVQTSPAKVLFELVPEAPYVLGAVEGPSLHVARGEVNFGTIWQGAVREVVFPLVSVGTEPLHIARIKASCGCTLVEARVIEPDGSPRALVYGEDLAPGTRVEVVAQFDSRGRHGYEKKTVEVYSDDVQGGHSLEVGVETEAWLVSHVEGIDFGRVFPGEPVTRMAHITSSSLEPFGLKASPSRQLPEGVTYTLTPDVQVPGESSPKALHWTLAVTLSPGVSEGVMMAPFLLESDVAFEDQGVESQPVTDPVADSNGDAPNIDPGTVVGLRRPEHHFLDVWSRATVLAPVVATTPYLSFGYLPVNSMTSASVRIECYDQGLLEAFLSTEPVVAMTDPNGGDLAHAKSFTPTLRRVEENATRPLGPGCLGAWDLEVSVAGFSGEGENRLQGRIEIALGGDESAIEPIFVTFQVIVQP